MNKFTPGPWIKEKRVNTFSFCINSDNPRKCIADVWDINTSPDETEANARLIAAAPDLYEALADLYDSDKPPGDKARAALAKVRGE